MPSQASSSHGLRRFLHYIPHGINGQLKRKAGDLTNTQKTSVTKRARSGSKEGGEDDVIVISDSRDGKDVREKLQEDTLNPTDVLKFFRLDPRSVGCVLDFLTSL